MKPIVSVIIPTYNRALFIEECLNSVLNQTYRPIELLVVDDGSTDDTERITQKFKKNKETSDFQVILLRQKNKGAPAARNKGIKNASGSFIQFLDSDDLLLPTKIEVELAFLENHKNLDYVYSKAQYIDDNKNYLDKYWGRELTQDSKDYFYFSYQTMCALYRKSAIEKYGKWDEELTISQDWEFSIRYILVGAKSTFINEVHSLFRKHSKGNIGASDRSAEKIKGKFIATRKVYNEIIIQNKSDNFIRKVFRKRFIYILLITSIYGSTNEKIEVNKFLLMKKIISRTILNLISKPLIAKLIIKIYDKI